MAVTLKQKVCWRAFGGPANRQARGQVCAVAAPRNTVSPWWMVVGVGVLLLGATGCQTIEKFRNNSIEKVTSARTWARDGFDALRTGQLARAEACFTNAARDLPDDYRLVANLARTEFDQGNIEKAIATMESALAGSNDPVLRVELGEMYLTAGQWDNANRNAERVLHDNFRLPAAWKLKGKLASARNDQHAALGHYQRAMGYRPNEVESEKLQMLIANTYIAMGRPMQALSAAETLLSEYAIDKHPEEIVLTKAEALIALRQHVLAINVLEMASRRPESSKKVFFRLGEVQLATGQRDRAYRTLTRAREAFPQDPAFDQLLAAVAPANSLNDRPPTLLGQGQEQEQGGSIFDRVAAIPTVVGTVGASEF